MLQGSFNTRALLGQDGEPWLYRSGNLDCISAADDALLEQLGITQIIDLRSKNERGAVLHTKHLEILPLYGEDNIPPQFDGIENTYQNLITEAGQQFAEAITLVANEPGKSLIHCMVGKDRTGLVIGLILAAAGVEDEDIFNDYALSEVEVKKHTEAMIMERYDAMTDLSEDLRQRAIELHLTSPAEALARIFENIRHNFGTIRDYLAHHGVTEDTFALLEEKYAGTRVEVS